MNKFLLLIVAAIGLAFLASCENDTKEVESFGKKQPLKDVATKITTYLSQGGKVKAKLTSPLMIRTQGDSILTEFPKTVHVDFYDSNKVVDTRLDAKYAKYLESRDKIYMRDSVRIVTTNGKTLLCEDLWWDQNSQKFYTDRKVIFNDTIAGIKDYLGLEGLEATQDLKDIRFKKSSGKTILKDGSL